MHLLSGIFPFSARLQGKVGLIGGDVLWVDEATLVVGRGYRTNEEGIRQLKEYTKEVVDNFMIVHLPHGNGPDECLHLMSFISFLDNDLAAVYSPLMPVVLREILLERRVQLIEVCEQEYENLGCNVLALAPRKCLIMEGNPKIKQAMEAAGVEVLEYKGKEIS